MAILAVDILIKSFLEFALADYRANPWLLDDVFGGLANDAMTRAESGWKEVAAAKKWFLETNIEVLLQHRVMDKPVLPCFSVAYNPSPEREDRAMLADEGFVTHEDSGQILKVYSPFTPASYNNTTGKVTFPKGITTDVMVKGQFLVSQVTGQAYVINKVINATTFQITPGIQDDFTNCFVSPPSSLYNVHREVTFQSESFTIGAHAENLPVHTQWMWQILVYSMGRYKESFLEGRGFELSTWRSGALERNADFGVQNVFSRHIDLSGTVEVSWIKFRAYRFDNVRMNITVADGPTQPDNYAVYGEELGSDQLWTTVNDPTTEES